MQRREHAQGNGNTLYVLLTIALVLFLRASYGNASVAKMFED
jgi:hypothetical protein